MITGNVSREQMEEMHDSAKQVLNKTGLRIDCDEYYGPLESRGAKVDTNSGVVRFPENLIKRSLT